MNLWHDINAGEKAPQIVNMIVEIPKESIKKYEYDTKLGVLRLNRFLYSSLHYSGDYGFIPQTLWEDGDPLDVFVLTHSPVYPLTLCDVKVIGVVRMIDNKESDDKILAVHEADPRFKEWDSIEKVPKHFLSEIENFFERYKEMENKKVKVQKILGREEAYKTIERAKKMYVDKFMKKEKK